MVGDSNCGLVRALGFVAWADDRLAPEEREMLSTVMDALEVPHERRAELCESLRHDGALLDGISDAIADEVERRFVMAQAIILAGIDGVIVDAERTKIAELARALGIEDDELEFIFEAVEATNDIQAGLELA